jgi:beta-phosphoglucomutase
VIFDLDGVITSTDEFHYRAWKQMADENGWKFDRTVNGQLRGVSRRKSLEIILEHNSVSLPEERIQELMAEKNANYRESLKSLTAHDVLPGTQELLEELRRADIRIALASASRNAPFILKQLELEDAFDFVSPAHLVIKGKPDPEVFVRAAEGVGCLPEECVGIEDAQAGIQAVKAACMKSVGIAGSVRDSGADFWAEDLAGVRLADLNRLFA